MITQGAPVATVSTTFFCSRSVAVTAPAVELAVHSIDPHTEAAVMDRVIRTFFPRYSETASMYCLPVAAAL
ncbi:hypothetical protein ACIOHC_28810 [Streptomyces sp. NPDC088252]|uniref:hypothetical protein n=1 Tax=Streptomyces sp. NPDC088252 TaxID=3365845 RepID=UPI003824D8AF